MANEAVVTSTLENLDMARFLAIHSLPGMTDEQTAQVLDACWAMTETVLLTTFANQETGRAICIWEAASAASVESALKGLEVPFEEVTEVVEYPRPADAG
jgi:hypothetical protein